MSRRRTEGTGRSRYDTLFIQKPKEKSTKYPRLGRKGNWDEGGCREHLTFEETPDFDRSEVRDRVSDRVSVTSDFWTTNQRTSCLPRWVFPEVFSTKPLQTTDLKTGEERWKL